MKILMKVVVASVWILGISTMVYSQEDVRKRNPEKNVQFVKIEIAKVAFFEQELNLTDKEKDKYWVTYNAYRESMKENARSKMNLKRELHAQLDSLSEKEVKSKFEAILALEVKEVQLKKEFIAKSSDIIGYKRAIKTFELERAFKQELMKRVKDGKEMEKKTSFQKAPQKVHHRVNSPN